MARNVDELDDLARDIDSGRALLSISMAEPVVLPAFLAEAMFQKLHLLMDIFHAMDVNQDGILSSEEFIKVRKSATSPRRRRSAT